jgi:hypothetical protein
VAELMSLAELVNGPGDRDGRGRADMARLSP